MTVSVLLAPMLTNPNLFWAEAICDDALTMTRRQLKMKQSFFIISSGQEGLVAMLGWLFVALLEELARLIGQDPGSYQSGGQTVTFARRHE